MNGQDQIELSGILYNVFGKAYSNLPSGKLALCEEIVRLADVEAAGGRPDWLGAAMDLQVRIGGDDNLEDCVLTLLNNKGG